MSKPSLDKAIKELAAAKREAAMAVLHLERMHQKFLAEHDHPIEKPVPHKESNKKL